MALEMLEKLFYFHPERSLKHHCQFSNIAVPLENDRYVTKDIYLFEVFYAYKCLSWYWLCEPIYHI